MNQNKSGIADNFFRVFFYIEFGDHSKKCTSEVVLNKNENTESHSGTRKKWKMKKAPSR